jgi:hypothetical protein
MVCNKEFKEFNAGVFDANYICPDCEEKLNKE